ncbi:MAG: DsbE family thiol:disulfide interchange protein [Rhodospirillaceae bacterium]|nr:DsbE family thiol:disulfide interchange protein [Rhodospirillaceae bacterium]
MTAVAAKRWPFLVPLLVVAALVGIFGKRLLDVQQGADPRLLPTVLLQTPFPEMDLPPLPGRAQGKGTLGIKTSELKGTVSLVNVWGSWCVACLAEHPLLMELAKSDDVPIHGIAWRDEPTASARWLAQHGDPYARIGQDPRSHAAIALGVTGAPETFVVDAAGVIRYKHIGPITPEIWRDTLQPLIASLRP